jgi:hypothetical protein
MPFPLAHPAAVLPLKRYCARWLNFPALVIGALVPDTAYLFRNDDISGLSHQVLGSIAYGLPAGFLMLAALYFLRTPAVEMLPNHRRRVFLSLCDRPIGPLWLAAVSLMIGIWTHVLWDSFTHNDGWLVGQLSILQTPVFRFGSRTARVCHLLWYGSTIAGVGWLFMAYENWKRSNEPELSRISNRNLIRYTMLLSLFVVPVALVHHIVRGTAGIILTAVLCSLLVVVFVMTMTRTRRRAGY